MEKTQNTKYKIQINLFVHGNFRTLSVFTIDRILSDSNRQNGCWRKCAS